MCTHSGQECWRVLEPGPAGGTGEGAEGEEPKSDQDSALVQDEGTLMILTVHGGGHIVDVVDTCHRNSVRISIDYWALVIKTSIFG